MPLATVLACLTLSGLAPVRAEAPRVIRVSVVSMLWRDDARTLEKALEYVEHAAHDGAEIVLLPMECVLTEGEAIPGPISEALCAKAREYGVYVIGNIREKDGEKRYVTSFLCDREGKLVGKYRKSHKMPDEDMALGDELPVFNTDFGPIAMRIGSDRFFCDIDHVYTVKGARIILWSQQPEPVEDEHSQDFPSLGRAADYKAYIACARYAFGEPGYITNKFPPYLGSPIGLSYVVDRGGRRIACTPRTGGGVATAAIPLPQLGAGRGRPRDIPGFTCLWEKRPAPEKKEYAKRQIRVGLVESHVGVDDLLQNLDRLGELGCDIACTYEFVWIHGQNEKQTQQAKANLARIAEKAKQHQMYVLVAGVVDRIERNEAILFDRDGREVGRYFKIAKTHDEQIPGEETPVLETDFGKIGVRICADEWMVELDRAYALKGAEMIFTPTQSWGPDALFRDLRDISRAMDTGMYLVEATHQCTEVRHRSMIVDPAGVVIARSAYNRAGIVYADIDLDNKPLRYVRDWTPHKPGGYLPQYQPDRLPKAMNDLQETILRQRRPELYQALAPEAK